MPRYGFKEDKQTMKIFVLFVMRYILNPVTLEEMSEMILIDDNMNYFLFADSVAELAESELLIKEPGSGSGPVYTLSQRGYNVLIALERKLSYSLRIAGQESVRKVLPRLRREKHIKTAIVMRGKEPMARLVMTDGQDPVFHIELMAVSRERAEKMCTTFKRNAEAIFDGVISLLLDAEE